MVSFLAESFPRGTHWVIACFRFVNRWDDLQCHIIIRGLFEILEILTLADYLYNHLEYIF